MKKWYTLLMAAIVSIVLAACGNGEEDTSSEEAESGVNGDLGQESIEIPYVEWDSEVASTHVIQQVLESEGYNVEITPLDNAIMWESVASGETDAMVSAWIPLTHGDLFEQHQDSLEDLGPNLEGAKIGLTVPEDFPVDSIADLKDEAGQTITAIEPGAGVVQAAERALEDYENLSDWKSSRHHQVRWQLNLDQQLMQVKKLLLQGGHHIGNSKAMTLNI